MFFIKIEPASRKQFFAVTILCGWCCLTLAQSTTNILDNFNRSGNLAGSSPNISDSNSGTATNWSGSSFRTTAANGGAMIAANASQYAALPFLARNGSVYTLSVTMAIQGGSTSDRWGAFGFDTGSGSSGIFNTKGPWMLMKYTGHMEAYYNGLTSVYAADNVGNVAPSNNLLQIVLDTTTTNAWKAQFKVNGVSYGSTVTLPSGFAVSNVAVFCYGSGISVTSTGLSVTSIRPTVPAISGQPTGLTNWAGVNASLNVAASGSQPLGYQWYKNSGSNALAGQTNATLNFTPLQGSNSSAYFVVITNSYGAVTSSVTTVRAETNAVMTLTPSISVGAIPASGSEGTAVLSSDYTLCALDFSTSATPFAINGITFTPVSASGTSASGTDSANGGAWSMTEASVLSCSLATVISPAGTQADGAMATMLNDAAALSGSIQIGDSMSLTFSNVAPASPYRLRLFYQQWNASSLPVGITFNGQGSNETVQVDENLGVSINSSGAYYVDYLFTAVTNSVSATLATTLAGKSAFLCGAMLQQVGVPVVPTSISVVPLPATGTDAASDINATNNYLCALDFGSLSTAVSVNGVSFQRISLSGSGTGTDNKHPLFSGTDPVYSGSWTLAANLSDGSSGMGSTASSAASQVDGSMASLLSDFSYMTGSGIQAGDNVTLTLGFLIPGASYSLRYYYRQYSTSGTLPRRPINFFFNGDGTNRAYVNNPLDLDAGGAGYVQYNFTATTKTVSLQASETVAGNGPHIYGVTLQQISGPGKPSIYTSPQGFTNSPGGSGMLSVLVSGTPRYGFQWWKNSAPVAEATNSSLVFSNLNASDTGAYLVVVTNVAGSVTSSVANVLVAEIPKLPLSPLDAALLAATTTADAITAASDANQATTNWIAHWIGPASSAANLWLCYRKGFSLATVPTNAIARIAVDSKYWLWINGQMVVREGNLKRGPTIGDTWYDQIDLAPFLQSGSNTIALLQWYFGKNGFSHTNSGSAGMVFELNAGGTLVKSDTTWRMVTNTAFQSASVVAQPNYRLPESSLRYDLRLDLGAWTNSSYNESGWGAPTDLGAAGGPPFGKLWQRPLPFWKSVTLTNFVSTNVSNGTNWTGQLPFNMRFTLWLDVSNSAGGSIITIKTDANAGGSDNPVSHEFVTGTGRQSFEMPAWVNGNVAYLTIPTNVTVYGLKYRPHQSDTEVLGSFDCSDSSLVTLWNKGVNTLGVNMCDTWSDCPDRERANWIGDATVDLGQTPYVFDPRAELTTRESILDVIRWQRADKTMFAPVPAGNWSSELPAQILATVGKYGVQRYFRNTGDTNFIRQAYPPLRDYLLNVWQTNSQGLVVHRAGGWNWFDWGSNIDEPLLDNTWYLMACEAAALMAPIVGQSADVPALTNRAQGIRNSFNTTFWTGSAYRSSSYSGPTDERGNAMAVLAGLPDLSMTNALRTVLTANINASPYMEKYVLEALFALGYPDDALNRMRSRYSSMIGSSATTLWENFPASGTFNHAWSGGPLTLLAEDVAGVTPTSPGFATFDVQPALGTTLKYVNLDVPSRHGVIRIGVYRNGANNKVSVRAPADATGRLIQPAGGALAGAMLSLGGGMTVTLDETVVPAEISVTNGTATLLTSLSTAAPIAKTGTGTLDLGSATLGAAGFAVRQGTLVIGSGGRLMVTGNVTNSATLRLTGNAQLNVSGTLANAGILDTINWNGTLPAGFANGGIVLDRSSIRLKTCSFNNQVFSLIIAGYAGHIYQMQRTASLNPPTWNDVGPAQTGGGTDLDFSHTNSPTGAGFYRIKVVHSP